MDYLFKISAIFSLIESGNVASDAHLRKNLEGFLSGIISNCRCSVENLIRSASSIYLGNLVNSAWENEIVVLPV